MSTLSKVLKQNFLWIVFMGLIVFAVFTRQDEHIFQSSGPYSYGKYILWLVFICFFAYSIYSGTKENFFKTLSTMTKLYWGWQIGLDLYIGVAFSLTVIGIHGGTVTLLIWLLPILFYANLATLLYFALNYDSIVSYFLLG